MDVNDLLKQLEKINTHSVELKQNAGGMTYIGSFKMNLMKVNREALQIQLGYYKQLLAEVNKINEKKKTELG